MKQNSSNTIFEHTAWQGEKLVCGIDEAGRGCFAGPVVVAAAVLKPGSTHKLLKDSKVLSQNQREDAFAWLQTNAWFTYGVGTPEEIESYNILQATKKKMVQAFINLMEQEKSLLPQLQILLIDAVKLELPPTYHPSHLKIEAFPYGESRSISIAAASIVAKVMRDKLMSTLHGSFPAYGFDQHKGYGTAQHQAALSSMGKSVVHRPSFLRKFDQAPPQHQQLLIG